MKTILKLAAFTCLLFLSLSSFSSDLPPPKLLLAKVYQSNIPLDEYWVSEKLDGVRAYWDGEQLISRQGNIFQAPKWFIEKLPNFPLDGELWMERNKFEKLSGTARTKTPVDTEWQQISYQIFDLPPEDNKTHTPFTERLKYMEEIIPALDIPWLKLIPQYKIANETSLYNKLQQIVDIGGEGLMLHRGSSLYKATRSDDLLKLKPYFDAEAIVIKHYPGKGKYTGMLGSILVENSDKIRFRIGTGFTDKQRKNPPPVGSTITFKYSGKSKNNAPKFASFLRMREKQ